MRGLELMRLWAALGWALVGAAVWLSLGPTSAVESAWVLVPFPYHDKFGHFIAYTAMMLWFSGLFRRDLHLLVAQYLFLLGLLLELTQGALGHRQADFGDLVANTAGIATGLLLARAGLEHWCLWVERALGMRRGRA